MKIKQIVLGCVLLLLPFVTGLTPISSSILLCIICSGVAVVLACLRPRIGLSDEAHTIATFSCALFFMAGLFALLAPFEIPAQMDMAGKTASVCLGVLAAGYYGYHLFFCDPEAYPAPDQRRRGVK